MPTRTMCVLITAASIASGLAAKDGSGNALKLLNAWLAQAAIAEPAYRTDLRVGDDSGPAASGRLSGVSQLLGPFTYRPKTYDMLTPFERAELLRDPKFRAFLVAVRERSDRGNGAGAFPIRSAAHPRPGDFSLTPEEILSPRELWLVLPL